MLAAICLVMLGGAFGSGARYLMTHLSSDLTKHHGFPFGTLAVNVLGSLAVGYILTWSADPSRDDWRLLAATGFCGGFTTFSTFAFESVAYAHTGKVWVMALNIAVNNALSLAAVAAGIRLHGAR